jgi:hypothetical protein
METPIIYFHEAVYMPRFNYDIDFWGHFDYMMVSVHAAIRQLERGFPILSLSEIRRQCRVIEVRLNNRGFDTVLVRIRYSSRRSLYYVISGTGVLVTGWWNDGWHQHQPASYHYYEVC